MRYSAKLVSAGLGVLSSCNVYKTKITDYDDTHPGPLVPRDWDRFFKDCCVYTEMSVNAHRNLLTWGFRKCPYLENGEMKRANITHYDQFPAAMFEPRLLTWGFVYSIMMCRNCLSKSRIDRWIGHGFQRIRVSMTSRYVAFCSSTHSCITHPFFRVQITTHLFDVYSPNIRTPRGWDHFHSCLQQQYVS